jgi:hypothetical protein
MPAFFSEGIGGIIIPMVLLFAVMYFMIIRPQKKREKLTRDMLSGLVVGDKIVTIGGSTGCGRFFIKQYSLVIYPAHCGNDGRGGAYEADGGSPTDDLCGYHVADYGGNRAG